MSAAAPAFVPVSEVEAIKGQLAQLMALIQTGALVAPAPVAPAHDVRTVRELWDEYARSFGGLPPKYLAVHRRFFTDFMFEFEGSEISLGSLPWTRLTPQMGHAWWAELREQTTKLKGEIKAVSAAYCNRIRTTGSGMFTWHQKQADQRDSRIRAANHVDNVTENPIHRWPRAGKDEMGGRKAGFIDNEQFEDFLRHAHPTLAEMMTMSVWCGGMRKNEVRRLRFAYINWSAATITLPGYFVKNGVERTFPVTPACMEILERRKKVRRSEFVFASPGSPEGEEIPESTMDHWMKEARASWDTQLNGNEEVVFHHCRHTFAKWSLLFGDTPSLVMEYGGWLSFDVFKGYAKANTLMIEQSRANKNQTVREAIDRAVGKTTAPTRRGAHRSTRFEPRTAKEAAE